MALGTGFTKSLPWLTSLETPVAVLQLTGALVGRDGKAIRIGSEGFYAKRTRLAISCVTWLPKSTMRMDSVGWTVMAGR